MSDKATNTYIYTYKHTYVVMRNTSEYMLIYKSTIGGAHIKDNVITSGGRVSESSRRWDARVYRPSELVRGKLENNEKNIFYIYNYLKQTICRRR